jgi:hypothetical protein
MIDQCRVCLIERNGNRNMVHIHGPTCHVLQLMPIEQSADNDILDSYSFFSKKKKKGKS